jgi:hypothetical protein
LGFALGFEARRWRQDRGETPLIDCSGGSLADWVGRVLAPDRFFLGSLLGGALRLGCCSIDSGTS